MHETFSIFLAPLDHIAPKNTVPYAQYRREIICNYHISVKTVVTGQSQIPLEVRSLDLTWCDLQQTLSWKMRVECMEAWEKNGDGAAHRRVFTPFSKKERWPSDLPTKAEIHASACCPSYGHTSNKWFTISEVLFSSLVVRSFLFWSRYLKRRKKETSNIQSCTLRLPNPTVPKLFKRKVATERTKQGIYKSTVWHIYKSRQCWQRYAISVMTYQPGLGSPTTVRAHQHQQKSETKGKYQKEYCWIITLAKSNS